MTAHHSAWGKQCLIAAALLFSVSAPGAIKPADAQTMQDVVVSVENHYRDLADLTAKVIQKNNLKSIGKTQKFEGTLWIKKPGKLRLEYSNGQLILINNKAALFYSKKSEQVIKKTFTDFEHMNIPVAFLLGAAHIRDDFDVLQSDPKTPRVLELLPKKPGAAMKKIRLVVDDVGRITELMIFDRSGNTTTMAFTDIREGIGLDDKLFVFKAPKGTEIIEQ
ncbi:MAG: outer membrane lipoprotein carrier protein LolA [Nitrospirae bacterium]|nr:outer membrane lipoprotein carrier protein LolA [Nitrospirota bacterium]